MPQGLLFTPPNSFLKFSFTLHFLRSISLENDARQSKDSKASPKKAKKSFWKLVNWKWVITAFLSSLSISMVLSLLSSEGLNYLNVFCSCLVLVFFVALGVIFDIIGLAVATADFKPFLAMAARKVRAGKTAVKLIKNADRVSSFCNDVIGDICGVVSGSTAAAVAIKIATTPSGTFWLGIVIGGLVSAFTVGSKAVGKALGLNFSNEIVMAVARILSIFSKNEKKAKYTKKSSKNSEE